MPFKETVILPNCPTKMNYLPCLRSRMLLKQWVRKLRHSMQSPKTPLSSMPSLNQKQFQLLSVQFCAKFLFQSTLVYGTCDQQLDNAASNTSVIPPSPWIDVPHWITDNAVKQMQEPKEDGGSKNTKYSPSGTSSTRFETKKQLKARVMDRPMMTSPQCHRLWAKLEYLKK